MRAVLVALLCGAGITSCASFKKEKSSAELRKERYEALLQTVRPGMYRQQLYAMLPPCEKPLSEPPLLLSVAYTGSKASPFYRPHMECHFLDEECYAIVFYQLKKESEYGPRHASGTMPDSVDFAPSRLSDWIPFRKGKPASKENPDDIILGVSRIQLKGGVPDKLQIPATSSPLQQEHGVKYGREMESGSDFPFIYPPPSPFAPGKPKAVSDRPPLP